MTGYANFKGFVTSFVVSMAGNPVSLFTATVSHEETTLSDMTRDTGLATVHTTHYSTARTTHLL